MQAFWQIVKRELAINLARKSEWLSVILFYVMVISLFPIAVGSWPKDLVWLAPVIIWIAALITTGAAQESLLQADFKIGAFEHMLLSQHSFSLLLFAKILAHWLIYALPMVMLTPILAISFGLSGSSIVMITSSLIIGTLILSLVGALGAALTVPLARGGPLLTMLILPLYIPVLTVGSSLCMLSVQGIISKGHIALLFAMAILAILCVPYAVAISIKESMQ